MVRRFDVEYDDFSGGFWVGGSAKQPRNTWIGVGARVSSRGRLQPCHAWESSGYTMPSTPGPPIIVQNTSLGETIVWMLAGASNAWAILPLNLWGGTPTLVTAAATPVSVNIRPVVFTDQVVCPTAAGSAINMINFSGSASSATTPALFTMMVAYDSFLFGSNFNNRVYYSAPLNPASWTSSDYYDIGGAGRRITCITVHQGLMYVGTTLGWFIASGIPDATFSVRQLNSYSGGKEAVSTETFVVVDKSTAGSVAPALVYGLRGSSREPLNLARLATTETTADEEVRSVSRVGKWIVVVAGGGLRTWLLDLETGAWFVVTNPMAFRHGADGSGASGRYVVASSTTGLYRLDMDDTWCGFDGTNYRSATVTLADYESLDPFRITEVVAEIELDSNPSLATRTLTVAVETPSATDFDLTTGSAAVTSSRTQTWSAAGTLQRATVRMLPDDSVATHRAIPRVTLAGVKLRRLILRCQGV